MASLSFACNKQILSSVGCPKLHSNYNEREFSTRNIFDSNHSENDINKAVFKIIYLNLTVLNNTMFCYHKELITMQLTGFNWKSGIETKT